MVKKAVQENWKRYVISSAITFFATFLLTVSLAINQFSWETVSIGAIGGALMAGVRAGLKAVIEMFVSWYSQRWQNSKSVL